MDNNTSSKFEDWAIGLLRRYHSVEWENIRFEFQNHWSDALEATLTKLVYHPDVDIRCDAIEMLLVFGTTDSIPMLLGLLNDPSHLVRRYVCGGLHDFGDARAIPRLVQVIRHDSDVEVRLVACDALGHIGDLTLVPFLEEVAERDTGVGGRGNTAKQMAEMAIQEIEERFGVFDPTKRTVWYETIVFEDGTSVRKLPKLF